MAWEHEVGDDLSFQCVSDLSAKQYHFVHLNGENQVVISGANDNSIGILQNKPLGTATQPATARVRVFGVSRVMGLDTSCTYGTRVGPGTGGEAVAVTTDKYHYNGMMLDTIVKAHDIGSVLLFGPQLHTG